MAFVMRSFLLLFCIGMLSLIEVAIAARSVPKASAKTSKLAEDKKQTDCLGESIGVAFGVGGVGTYLGGGAVGIPSTPYVGGGRIPSNGGATNVGGGVSSGTSSAPSNGNTGLDKSIPAASNPQFVPGLDDTFVPNPGVELPNPVRGIIP